MFKTGDRVRCISEDRFFNRVAKVGDVFTVATAEKNVFAIQDGSVWWSKCFEITEQTPQVGDVWGSADRREILRVVSVYKDIVGVETLSDRTIGLTGNVDGNPKGFLQNKFLALFLYQYKLLSRAKPQPKKMKKAKKQSQVESPRKKEDKWERISGYFGNICRAGNKIRYVIENINGVHTGMAICRKGDVFNVEYGVDLAYYRAQVIANQAAVDNLLKEGSK